MCLITSREASNSNMDDLKKKLSRSLSGPRRCSYCQKMVYFSIARCKECGDVTHKHCNHHKNHHGMTTANKDADNVCYPINADPALWCSVDHAKETSKNRTMSDSSYDYDESRQGALRHHSASVAMTGLLKIFRWLSHRKKTKELYCKSNPAAIEKHVKERFGLNPKLEDKEAKKKLKALLKSTQNYQRQLYGYGPPPQQQQQQQQQKQLLFQRQRCSSARSAPSATSNRVQRRLCRSFAIRSTDSPSPRGSVSSCNELASPFSTPKSNHGERYSNNNKNSVLTNGGETSFRSQNREQNPVQSPHSSHVSPEDHHLTSGQAFSRAVLLPECSNWTFGDSRTCKFGYDPKNRVSDNIDSSRASNFQFAKRPCIGKAKTLSLESHDCNNDSLCATWPPVGKAGTIIEEEGSDDEEGIEESGVDSFSSDCHRSEENIREWCIPFGDIEFQERIRNGRQGDIFKGRWYGEVLIYTIRHSCSTELRQFLEDVAQMGMIRHENIVLFMGACIEPPKLAVITSMRKGPTLYEYLHLKRNRLPFHSKLNIARQIAQGMGYLHAKGITHKKLNSKNIILESRVKLCMMDYGMADKKLDRNNCGCISRGQLSYISPELMRSLTIDPPGIYPTASHTQQSDVFAFGSLLFELLAEKFAFHDQHPHAIIWKVATGKRCSLENFRFITGLKSLIRKCWSQNSTNRPPFSEIVNVLQENVSHHKRHSSSVPDKLQYTGHSLRRNICT